MYELFDNIVFLNHNIDDGIQIKIFLNGKP
jgi:hypothetical protein